MSTAEEMLAEFETQASVTRKFLERLPPNLLQWQPHRKSMTAGQLAYHLAMVPGAVCRGAQLKEVPPPNFNHPQPDSVEQVLEAFEESIATVREVLPAFDDAALQEPWRIVADGKVLVEMPRGAFLRDIMLNHWYQHRGQFSVYLRLLNVAVPSSWGPSADEPVAFS
ncbi:MAG TPA: DinB family protein [Acidobacteriaceae bacterium]